MPSSRNKSIEVYFLNYDFYWAYQLRKHGNEIEPNRLKTQSMGSADRVGSHMFSILKIS